MHVKDIELLRDVCAEYEVEHPGSILTDKPEPDPTRPGAVVAARIRQCGQAERMEGGNVMFGEWDCSRCGKPFYMEIAFDRDAKPVDSVGGIIAGPETYLCDACSPI